jgi:hypothetical protein
MIWLSLTVPVIGIFLMYYWFRKKFQIKDLLIPLGICLVLTCALKLIGEETQVSCIEYEGDLGYKAQYYEPWSTWVDQTCARQVACGTDSKGNTQYCTKSYDCSYCSDHGADYYLVDYSGHKFDISVTYYNYLTKKWSATPKFVELARDIDHHGSCGVDGDLYEIFWDRKVLTSVPTTWTHIYENRVKVSSSAFRYPTVSEQDKQMYGLYDYPEVKGFNQQSVLGAEQFSWLSPVDKVLAEKYCQYLCGYYGPRKQLKLWVLLYKNQPSLSADMQEAYWNNGNKNEMVVCIGLDSVSRKIQWVRPFSWTTNRTLLADIREDLMEIGDYDFLRIYPVLSKNLSSFERRHFKEFKYLSVQSPTWAIVLTYILNLIVTGLYGYLRFIRGSF